MEIALENGETIRGITLAETGMDNVYVENEDYDEDMEYEYDGSCKFSLQQIVTVKRCQSITIQGSGVKDDAEDLSSDRINALRTFDESDPLLDLTDVESADQVSENSVEVRFQDGFTKTISGKIQCAYVYF